MLTNIFSNFFVILFISLLSVQLTSALVCFQCNDCDDITSCTCDNVITIDTETSYCILLRESSSNAINIEIKHIPRNSTTYYIYDPYYISVQEKISYDGSIRSWYTKSNKITYACQTDKCNQADLIKQLPSNGLSLMLPKDWLDENLLRKPDKITTPCRNCEGETICDDAANLMNINKCNIKECQGSCIMGETFEKAETTQFCYESFCTDDMSIGPVMQVPEIVITAVYYINKKQLDIVEIDLQCNGNDCSRLQIFKDIKDKLQKDLNGIKPFLPPNNHGNAIYSTSVIFLMMILLQTLFFY